MTTRYKLPSISRYGVAGVPSGYSGDRTSYEIAPCGIEDVDRALYEQFDKHIVLQTSTQDGQKKVPVIFAAGEKWAMLKKGTPIRDNNGTLILPLITIARTDVQQSYDRDISGRGQNQHTGELVIKRRLHRDDRNLQSWLNRQLLQNQTNVAVAQASSIQDQFTTTRTQGDLSDDPTSVDGGLLFSDVRGSAVEVITIPAPQFITVKYEVTLWTLHQQQMNQMIEGILSSYMPQVRGWQVMTDKGYWFVASVMSDEFSNKGNSDDVSMKERVLRHSFSVEVPAFIVASSAPGVPVAVKSYVSCPTVSFDVSLSTMDGFESDVVEEPFLGSDDPTLSLSTRDENSRRDGREDGRSGIFPPKSVLDENDPALKNVKYRDRSRWRRVLVKDHLGEKSYRYLRIKTTNKKTGETILDTTSLAGLEIVYIDS